MHTFQCGQKLFHLMATDILLMESLHILISKTGESETLEILSKFSHV